MPSLNEFIVKDAALSWFGEFGHGAEETGVAA